MNQLEYNRNEYALSTYPDLLAKREELIEEYVVILTKLTKVTRNISPMPFGGEKPGPEEGVMELVKIRDEIESIENRISRIDNAVADLPLALRFLVRRHYFFGLKLNEIAEIQHVSYRTIKRRKAQAIKLLRL